MRASYLLLGVLVLFPLALQSASAQLPITVNSTDICFFNYTAGWRVWQNCGLDTDFIAFSLLPWEWITGGYFSLVIVAILVLITYIKYQKVAYPMMIGIMFLPVSFFLFPDVFLSFMFVMFGVGATALIWYAFIKQTKEY